MGTHSAFRKSGQSPRVGETLMTGMPAFASSRSQCSCVCSGRTARGHLPVLQRQPAEGEKELAMLEDARPGGGTAGERLIGADDVGQRNCAVPQL